MFAPLAAAALAFAGLAPADTIVPARPGDQLVVQNLSGDFLVRTWGRDEVEVTSPGGRAAVVVHVSGDRIELERGDWRDWDDDASYRITVPEWMAVELSGTELTASVDGVRGGVRVHTVEGDVTVRDAEGGVGIYSVDGIIRVEDVRGDVDLRSGDDDIVVRSVVGNVRAESVDGDVLLRDVSGDQVTGTTVDGDVSFRGPLRPGGAYRFVTHDGDVVVDVHGELNAAVTVSTFEGEFQSEFPITVDRIEGRHEYRFTLGDGSSSLSLQAFDGDIRLRRSR